MDIPERLVFTLTQIEAGRIVLESLVTVTFTAVGLGTRMDFHQTGFDTPFAETTSAEAGASVSRNSLEALVEAAKMDGEQALDESIQENMGRGVGGAVTTGLRHLAPRRGGMMRLHRLDRSLHAVQAGCEGCTGFSDQAHQIREWRRRLRTAHTAATRVAVARRWPRHSAAPTHR